MEINELRKRINELDNEIINAIRKRFELSKLIGDEKQKQNIKIRDSKREEEIISRIIARNKDIDAGFIAELYDTILSESKRLQEAE